ncbi:MAG: malto-oligosyltrehalose trehalohydrolase [Actinobacteria bacterium]|nr:malto-oligosyltrehalose trehalohydrolase [Actinomycetota bacterium]
MVSVRVWAPLARKSVTLVADGTPHPMSPEGDGWWAVERPLDHDYEYAFILDDDPALVPDPRSLRQPHGVHGLSRTFDPGAFAWTDDRWTGRQLAGSVVYELHVGTFTPGGTLDAAIERLDHLVALGIDAIELLPVNSFNGDHNWGYDGVLWYAVDETYGGPEAYQRFVDACHAHGLAVVQDVVYNHLGPSGNYLPKFGPYLHEASSNSWGSSIDFSIPEVRRYVIDNALMWLRDFHVDGLRLDAVHALVDTSPTHILVELGEEVDALSAFERRPLTLIAESDQNDPALITPREAGGYGIHAQWSDDFHQTLHVALTGETFGYYADFEPLDALAKVYRHGFFHDGTYSSFRGRDHGRPIDVHSMPAWRLVVANQTHDQIGNRAAGDRLAASLDAGQLMIAAALTLSGPFTPMLFMGEEWAASTPWQFYTAHPEPDLGTATAEGRLNEFAQMGWDPELVPDPQDPDTFRRSKLDWDELGRDDHARVLQFYTDVLALRRSLPELTDPRFASLQIELDDVARWVIVRRGSRVAIAANLGTAPVELDLCGELLVASSPEVSMGEVVALPGHSVAIIRLH